MAEREILLLGNPKLYEKSEPVVRDEITYLRGVVSDLHDTLIAFRNRYGAGRAIAAPQIGVMKRLFYMFVDDVSTVFVNPELTDISEEMFELWDDCMSFPDLLVRVKRYRSCHIRFRDMDWEEREISAEGDLSELLQHEYDHLDGILAVSKAIDGQAFALRSEKGLLAQVGGNQSSRIP